MNFRDSSTLPVIIACFVFITILAGFVIIRQRHSPSYIQKTVDKDTGEVIYNEPNKTKEVQSNPDNLVILGSPQLIGAGLTQDQYQLTKQAFISFSKQNLQNKYTTLKILTSDFKKEQNNIYAKLRLGESDTVLDLSINYRDLKFVQVRISDPKGNKTYSFDSGELQINQVKKPAVELDTN